MEKGESFQQMVLEQLAINRQTDRQNKRNIPNPYVTPYTQTITRAKTITFLEESKTKFYDFGLLKTSSIGRKNI